MLLLFGEWLCLHFQVKHKRDTPTLVDSLGKANILEENLQNVVPRWS